MSYATLAEIKSHLGITDTDDDTQLTLALSAASSMVNRYCKRTFNDAGATPTVQSRYYTSRRAGVLFVDDLATATSLTIATDDGTGAYATTIAATDYTLEPINAALRGEPYTQIYSDEWPGDVRHGVKVTGIYGWPAVPTEVKSAELIQAARIFNRKNSPYGIAGSPEVGSELRLLAKLDPDVEQLLTGLRRIVLE